MKTPMQEMIEVIKEKLKEDTLHYNTQPSNGGLIAIRMSQFYLEMTESLLEKEKDVIIDAFRYGNSNEILGKKHPEEYYSETFNTKEK